jgi:choline dehydrogenase-like flavoprotein
MELDAQMATDGTAHSADLCIVGAGPAGLALAHGLAAAGLNIVLIESGADGDGPARELNGGSNVGDPMADLRESRARSVGGTSVLWNTVRRGVAGAKYVPLDSIDFASRDELPWSGWPITRASLDPWYRRAQSLLGLGTFDASDVTWSDRRHSLLPFRSDGLTSTAYQWGPADTFRRRIPNALRASTRVVLIRNATVTKLVGEDGATITEARWAAFSGARGTVRATRFVLAAGAIENARLLLASRIPSVAADGWLGRGLMEHPVDRSLRLVSRHPALSPVAGFYAPFGTGRRAHVIGRIGCSDGLLHGDRLWNASLRIFPIRERRLTRIAKRLVSLVGGAPVTGYRVLLDLEQAPHRENRVVLSDRCDPLGVPRVVVHWRWHAADEANRQRMLAAIVREFSVSGAGQMEVVPGLPVDPDVHHHAGTTRMHEDPQEGVVNPDLRVHGLDNLFVIGASVFPTTGVANPTLTIVALALRLADHLSRWSIVDDRWSIVDSR